MANEKLLIDGNKAKAVLVNMAEHLQEAGNPEMAGAVGYAAEVIGKQHAVDAVEVVHGRWILCQDDGYEWYECSSCRAQPLNDNIERPVLSDYCPNCGAKMDGGN